MPTLDPTLTFFAITVVMTAIALGFALPGVAARGAADAGRAARPASWRMALAVAALLPALAFAIYARLGEPGAVAAQSAAMSAATIEGVATPQFVEELVRHLDRNPRDTRGWVLLGRAESAAGRHDAAATAYAKALGIGDKTANDPAVWCEYADALAMAQGGALAGKPRELIAHALALDPGHGKALEMAGSAAFEAGEFADAAAYWRALVAQMPEGDPMRRDLDAAITRADLLAATR